MYRVVIAMPLYRAQVGVFRTQASTIASITASVMNLIIILILGKIYQRLALSFTRWGQHVYLLSLFFKPTSTKPA